METILFDESSVLDDITATALLYHEDTTLKNKLFAGDFSFFQKPVRNTIPSATMSVVEVYNLITSRQYEHQTLMLRTLKDKDTARNYKANYFDYSCFSGIFYKRSESGLIVHSSLLTLDFDHVNDLNGLKHKLIHNYYFDTILAFTSPSGDGLKWIIKIDLTKNTHLSWFIAIADYCRNNYYLEVDKSGKDVSRCCFLPYDPDAYINPQYIK